MSIPSSVLAAGWIPFVIVLVVSHEITFSPDIMRTFGKPSRMQQLDQTSSTNTHSDTPHTCHMTSFSFLCLLYFLRISQLNTRMT